MPDDSQDLQTNLIDPFDASAFPAQPISKVMLAMPNVVAEFTGPNHTRFEDVPGFDAVAAGMGGTPAQVPVETIDTTGIPSANVLMEPDFGVETICGTDNRVQVNTTGTWPWASYCSLLIDFGKITVIGSGWLIGPNSIVTAGHCVYNRTYGWAKSVKVMPGRNGATLPFGSSMAKELWSVKGWVNNGLKAYDYGFVVMDSALGKKTGWIGYGVFPDSVLENQNNNITGYPGDKPSGTMWYAGGKIKSADSLRLYYMEDTTGGESGCPVWMTDYKNSKFGIGIHNYGGCPNSANRITQSVFYNMVKIANR